MQLSKLKINVWNNNENKKLFITAFWKQRINKRMFDVVMTHFYAVCHNYGQPEDFGAWIE